jgi:hypothetical protein
MPAPQKGVGVIYTYIVFLKPGFPIFVRRQKVDMQWRKRIVAV